MLLRILFCFSIVFMVMHYHDLAFLIGYDTGGASEVENFFEKLYSKNGQKTVQQRICGRTNDDGKVEQKPEPEESSKEEAESDDESNENQEIEIREPQQETNDNLLPGTCLIVTDSIERIGEDILNIRRDMVIVPDENSAEKQEGGDVLHTTCLIPPVYSENDENIQKFNSSTWSVCYTLLLEADYNLAMIENLFIWHPSSWSGSHRLSVLHIGISGGQTNNYINAIFPHIHQVTVESSQFMIDLYQKWYKPKYSETNKIVVADEFKFIAESVAEGLKYDVIFAKKCDESLNNCPSDIMKDPDTLIMMRELLTENGVIAFRLKAASKMNEAALIDNTKSLFDSIFPFCYADVRFSKPNNKLMICSKKEMAFPKLKKKLEDMHRGMFRLIHKYPCGYGEKN